jgi:hypothetical protein
MSPLTSPDPRTTTKYYRVKVYVGPVHVAAYTKEAHGRGLAGAWAGTEHVYGTVASRPLLTDSDRVCFAQHVADLVYGTPMAAGWRDVTILGTE